MATRRTSQNGSLLHGNSAFYILTSSRTRFLSLGTLTGDPTASSKGMSICVTRAGSVVSRASMTDMFALAERASNRFRDSMLACSRKVARLSRKDVFRYSSKGISTARPGKSHWSAFSAARTSSAEGDASKTSAITVSTPSLRLHYSKFG